MPRENVELDDEDILGQDFEDDDIEEGAGEEDEGEADEGSRQGSREPEGEADDEGVLRRQPERQSRRDRRIDSLINANRQAEERAARAERQVQEYLAQQRQPQREDPAVEAQRLAMMTPEERMEYRFVQSEERHARERQAMEARMADQQDQTRYQARAASNSIYRKYEADVERSHMELRSKGQFVAREAILKFILGERMLQKAEAAAPKQRQRGKENIRRQTTQPGNRARQDVQTDRRRSGDTPASRLEGVQI